MGDNYDKPVFYSILIDPLLISVQNKIPALIKENSSLIDISCGTGSFSRILSKRCRNVTGVDISPDMISFAEERSKKENISNTVFINKDFLELKNEIFSDVFDYAVLSMAVHQFDENLRFKFLKKAADIAERIFVLDYASPVKPRLMKTMIYSIEYVAGKEHFRNFKSYNSEQGIPAILEKYNFKNIINHETGSDIFRIVSFGKNINS